MWVNMLAGLLDAYFSLPTYPDAATQAKLQDAYSRLHKTISSQLQCWPRKSLAWAKVSVALPSDSATFALARSQWWGAETALHRFMLDHPKHASVVEATPLSSTEVADCRRLQESLDATVAEAESVALDTMRTSSPAPSAPTFDEQHELAKLCRCFDRPAFYTPFYQEASLPDFRKALADTIEALNTGHRRLRDGTLIETVRQRHEFSDPRIRDRLSKIEHMVVKLRSDFDALVSAKQIWRITIPGSSIQEYRAKPKACLQIDQSRAAILDAVRRLCPEFKVTLARDATIGVFPMQTDDDGNLRIGATFTNVKVKPVQWSPPMSITELAKRLGLDRNTVSKYIKKQDGNGMPFKKVGNKYCVPADELPEPPPA